MQREVQGVMEVVVEIRAGADDEIDQAAIHQFDHAAAETGRRQRAGDREPDGRVVFRRQHLVGKNVAGLRQPSGVERLKSAVDQARTSALPRGR